MKRYIVLAIILVTAIFSASAQQSYMIDKAVAVFYPKDFRSDKHLPSPVFERELSPVGPLDPSWKIRPEYSQQDGRSVARITIGEDDDIYGTGEVIGDLRRNGKEVVFWNSDNYGYTKNEGKNLYQSHPWVLGLRKDGSAYGIIADNTWKSSLKSEGNTLTFVSEGPAFRIIVIEGESSKEVLKTLAKLSGTMELPPMWAIGYQQCRYSYYPDTRVKNIVDSLRQERFPADVVWMDIDYMDSFKVFTFNPETFPDPHGLADHIHARDMKAVYMIDPGIKVEPGYFVYDQGHANDYFVKKPDGTEFTGSVWPGPCNFPDYTRHEVRSWWSGLTKEFMLKGADGLWNDMNEPSVFDGVDGTMDEDAMHLGGDGYTADSHLRYHNVYGMNMVKASKEGSLLAHPDKRPFVLSRDNFLGGQKYGATWTGDNRSSWDHLKMSIPMTLNLGLSGQPFNGPDLGGFGADAEAELLAHWYATGVYFPFVRNHSEKGTVNQEPWAFGKRIEDICRTAVERRYRLLPYIYTLFREASIDGLPVMRPLFMADEKDLSLRQEQRVYMLGDDLMIIPRWATDPSLPKGDWDIIRFEDKDDEYQAYVALRPGAIVPMANLYQSTEQFKTDSLTLLVNPAADGLASGVMYEDAKDGFEYRKGQFAEYAFTATTDAKGVLTVTMRQTGGNADYGQKTLRIAYVYDGKILFSPWVIGDSVTMKIPKEKEFSLDPSKLVFADIKGQPTTAR